MWREIGTMKPNYLSPRRATLALSALVILAALCFSTWSCGTVNVGLIPPEQMAPRELATYAMATYNAQYDDFMVRATLPNLSGAEKTILRAKKESLTQAWPVIRTFTWYVDQSHHPPPELQAQLLAWLNSVRY